MPQTKYGYPDEFLQRIMQLESSGGSNTNHQPIQQGLQAGTSAIGRYGLMPNTIKEAINRRRLEQTMTPELHDLDQMNQDQMKSYVESNPDLEEQLAKGLATHVLRKQQGDEDKAAFAWHQGHNLQPNDISAQKLNDLTSVGGDYVDRFRRVKDLLRKPAGEEDDDQ